MDEEQENSQENEDIKIFEVLCSKTPEVSESNCKKQ